MQTMTAAGLPSFTRSGVSCWAICRGALGAWVHRAWGRTYAAFGTKCMPNSKRELNAALQRMAASKRRCSLGVTEAAVYCKRST